MIISPYQKPERGRKLNKTHPLARGLVGCWVMNERDGGEIFDLSNNRKGYFNANAGNYPTWDSDGGILFDSNGESIKGPNGAFLRSAGTILFGYKYTNDPANYFYWFVLEDDPDEFCAYGSPSDGDVVFSINGSWPVRTGIDNFWKTGKIQNIGFTWDDDSNIREIYNNGLLIDSYNDSFSWDVWGVAAHNLHIGGRLTGANRYAGGIIYYFYAFDRVLLPSEIAWLHREPYAMFMPYLDPAIFYAAAGGSVIKVVNETLQFSESVVKLQAAKKVVNETLQLSEAVEKKGATKKVINETLQFSEFASKSMATKKIINETLQLTEGTKKVSRITKIINETLQLAESVIKTSGIIKIINETLQLSESLVKKGAIKKIINEGLQLSENIVKKGNIIKVINETLQLVEGVVKKSGIIKIVNETLQLAENIVKRTGIVRVINETLQLSENVVKKTGITKIINETIQLSESLVKKGAIKKIVNETLQLSENILKKGSIIKVIAETLQFAESVVKKSGLIKIINEVLNISEAIVKSLKAITGWKEAVKKNSLITLGASKNSTITLGITKESLITTSIEGNSPLN